MPTLTDRSATRSRLLALAATVLLATTARAGTAVVTLTPNHGVSGTTVQVDACGFPWDRAGGTFDIVVDCVMVRTGVGGAPRGLQGVGFGTGVTTKAELIPISGKAGAHVVSVQRSLRGRPHPSASATFTIDQPAMAAQIARPAPPSAGALNASIVRNPGLLSLAVHVDGVDPNPGRPDQPVRVRFTVQNHTATDANVNIDGTAGGSRLSGHDKHAAIPAHGQSSLSLQTMVPVAPGNQTADVHVVLPGATHVRPGQFGQPVTVTETTAEVSDAMPFTVKAACVTKSKDAGPLETLIVLFEKLSGDPHIPGLSWRPLFVNNHYDLSAAVHPSETWQRDLLRTIWLGLSNGDGNTTTAVQGNAIHFHQEYDVHLDAVDMVWYMRVDLDVVPTLNGGVLSTTPQNFHLSLDVPNGDQAGLALMSGGLWFAAIAGLESYLQGVAQAQVAGPIANGIAAELGLAGYFPPQDDDGRSRSRLSTAAPNIVVSYCYPGF